MGLPLNTVNGRPYGALVQDRAFPVGGGWQATIACQCGSPRAGGQAGRRVVTLAVCLAVVLSAEPYASMIRSGSVSARLPPLSVLIGRRSSASGCDGPSVSPRRARHGAQKARHGPTSAAGP